MEFPYQLVSFLGATPKVGEHIYEGEHGWYPQIALKRRFGLAHITEEQLIERLERYCVETASFEVHVLGVTRPKKMPVDVIEVEPTPELMAFHLGFIATMGSDIQQKFPDREGDNYHPHITVEFHQKQLFDPASFVNTTRTVNEIWLVKDIEGVSDTAAYRKFKLGA